MDGDLALAAVQSAAAVGVLWRGFRPLSAQDLAKWQRRFAAAVPPEAIDFVSGRLQRARRLRSSLIAVGVTVSGLPAYMNLIDPSRSADFANFLVGNAWLIGAALGAVIAEAAVVQRPTRRVAALVARRPQDYVDARFVRAVLFSLPITLTLAGVATAINSSQWWESWVGAAATGMAAIGVRVGLRAIADRPALDPAGPMAEVDDALRADGAHHLVGAAVALAAVGTAGAVPSLNGWPAIFTIVAQYVSVLGYVWWWTLAREIRWSVRQARATA